MSGFDTKLFRLINDLAEKSEFRDQVFIFSSNYGLYIFAGVLIVLFFWRRRLFWAALVSVILSRAIITEVLRYFLKRPRPFVALKNVRLLVEKNAAEPSFPSGHAAIYFAIAFAVYLFNRKIGVILIIAALLASLARVYTGIHYPSDILGGILVALFSVYLVNKLKRMR